MEIGLIGIVLIIINAVVSYNGLHNSAFFDRYKFEIDSILIKKEYKRLLTSGFLHVNWLHLLLNMLSLYMFGGSLENQLGIIYFLLIYIVSLIGGNLLTLYIHRNHGDYNAVGASGAVCGVIFASIALFPGMQIGLFGLPLFFPSWIYAILFILFSIYGIKSQKDNIGHEAHLGGALLGLLTVIAIHPTSLFENYLTILIVALPTIIFLYLIITRPHILLFNDINFKNQKKYYTIDDQYNSERREKEIEIDKILEKISKNGLESLTKKEKNTLDEYSKK